MKKLFLLSCLLVSLFSFCQSTSTRIKDKEQSKLEIFSDKSGSLIKKEFIDVGKIKSLSIQVLEITDLLNSAKVKGLRLEYEPHSALGSSTKMAFIDADEVDALLKALNYIKENIINTQPDNYQEVKFKSRGGFQGGCFIDTKKKWEVFFQLESYDTRSSIFFDVDDMERIIDIFMRGKQKLS